MPSKVYNAFTKLFGVFCLSGVLKCFAQLDSPHRAVGAFVKAPGVSFWTRRFLAIVSGCLVLLCLVSRGQNGAESVWIWVSKLTGSPKKFCICCQLPCTGFLAFWKLRLFSLSDFRHDKCLHASDAFFSFTLCSLKSYKLLLLEGLLLKVKQALVSLGKITRHEFLMQVMSHLQERRSNGVCVMIGGTV